MDSSPTIEIIAMLAMGFAGYVAGYAHGISFRETAPWR